MSTGPRTITLPTEDHGDVTLPEPSWCIGHAHHDPESARADILHSGPDITLAFHGAEVIAASLAQSPHATLITPGLGGRTVGVSVSPIARTLAPVDLYCFAAALDGYADQLRDLADQLTAILAGGETR